MQESTGRPSQGGQRPLTNKLDWKQYPQYSTCGTGPWMQSPWRPLLRSFVDYLNSRRGADTLPPPALLRTPCRPRQMCWLVCRVLTAPRASLEQLSGSELRSGGRAHTGSLRIYRAGVRRHRCGVLWPRLVYPDPTDRAPRRWPRARWRTLLLLLLLRSSLSIARGGCTAASRVVLRPCTRLQKASSSSCGCRRRATAAAVAAATATCCHGCRCCPCWRATAAAARGPAAATANDGAAGASACASAIGC
jgi:hypothetical protein